MYLATNILILLVENKHYLYVPIYTPNSIGLFENAYKAQNAAQELISAGFLADDIDVSINGKTVTSSSYNSSSEEDYNNDADSNTSADGTSTGSMSGGTGDYATGTSGGYRTGAEADDIAGNALPGYISGIGYTPGTLSSPDADNTSSSRTVNDVYSSSGSSTDSDYSSSERSEDNDQNSFGDKVSRFFKTYLGTMILMMKLLTAMHT